MGLISYHLVGKMLSLWTPVCNRILAITICLFFISLCGLKGQTFSERLKVAPVRMSVIQPTVVKGQDLVKSEGISVRAIVEDGDTFPFFALPTYYVYPPLKFKNKKQEKFYWRTVYDVKKVLPLSRYIRSVIEETNDTLITMSLAKDRRRYMRGFEKELYKREYERMNKLTLNQGKLLIRLVSREMDATGYDLIKAYRGGFRAGFYQMFARMFGANLKWEYGDREEDEIIERVINLVEAGQL